MVGVRKGALQDAEHITAFNVAMAKETEDLNLDVAIVAHGVSAVLKKDADGEYYVLEDEGKIVGQLMITREWSDWRNKYWWWIQSVYVIPEHRGNGYFRVLYDHVKREAGIAGAAGIRLYADMNNKKAQAVYEQLGMTSHYKVYEDPVVEDSSATASGSAS